MTNTILQPVDRIEIEPTDEIQVLPLRNGTITCCTRVFVVGEEGRQEITRQATEDEIHRARISGAAP